MKERRRAGNTMGMANQRIEANMKKILRQNVGTLSVLLFLLSPMHIFAKDITVSKTLLAYTVTINAVDTELMLKGSKQKTRVNFTILPLKYVPTKVTGYAGDASFNLPITITHGGSYAMDLEEGTHFIEAKHYALKIGVDNAISNSVNVTVFDFDGELHPVDDFDTKRNYQIYGLKELVNAKSNITPNDITLDQVGGLGWRKITIGVGAISADDQTATAVYNAGDVPGETELCLVIRSGPNSGMFKCYGRTIVAPNGTYMTLARNIVWHQQYYPSAGIPLYYWLEPKDVSFKNMTFAEGDCLATNVTGIFLSPVGDPGPHVGRIFSGGLDYCNSLTGCRTVLEDHAGFLYDPWFTGVYVPWGDGGTFTWSIPTQYLDDFGTRYLFGTNQIHIGTIQPNGYATISKGGWSGSAAVAANTVNW